MLGREVRKSVVPGKAMTRHAPTNLRICACTRNRSLPSNHIHQNRQAGRQAGRRTSTSTSRYVQRVDRQRLLRTYYRSSSVAGRDKRRQYFCKSLRSLGRLVRNLELVIAGRSQQRQADLDMVCQLASHCASGFWRRLGRVAAVKSMDLRVRARPSLRHNAPLVRATWSLPQLSTKPASANTSERAIGTFGKKRQTHRG